MIPLQTDNFDAILFDMDGVLLDSEPLHFESFRRVFAPMGIELADEYLYKFVGDPLSRNLQDIEKDFNIKLNARFLKAKIETAYLDILEESSIQPNPGICELLYDAHKGGLKTGICTSSPLHQAEIIQDKIRAAYSFNTNGALFHAIVSGDMVQSTKPHPGPYLLLAQKLSVSPSKCLAIEDSFSGVTSAKKAGCFTIAFKNSYNKENDFLDADAIVDSVREIRLV